MQLKMLESSELILMKKFNRDSYKEEGTALVVYRNKATPYPIKNHTLLLGANRNEENRFSSWSQVLDTTHGVQIPEMNYRIEIVQTSCLDSKRLHIRTEEITFHPTSTRMGLEMSEIK
jgi:hypothetical protein